MKILTYEELFQLKWITGGLMALVALWTGFYMQMDALMYLLPGSLLVIAALVRPSWTERVNGVVWKVLTPVLLVLVVIDFILSAPDVLPPLVRMIVLLSVVRSIAPRSQREDLQLILLTLVMVTLSGVLTVSLLFAFQLLLYAPLAMLCLFTINLVEATERGLAQPPQLWRRFRWRHFLTRLRDVLDFRMAVFGGAMYLAVLALTLVIFFSLPRFRLDQAIPFLQLKSNQTLSGFSETVRFGEVVDIIQSDQVALRVDVPTESDIPAMPYWRMLALDQYTGEGFRISASTQRFAEWRQAAAFGDARDPSAVADPTRTWTFYLEPGVSRYLPRVGPFDGIRFANRQDVRFFMPLWTINLRDTYAKVLSYQIIGMDAVDFFPSQNIDGILDRIDTIAVPIEERIDDENVLRYPQTTLVVPAGEANQRILSDAVAEIRDGETGLGAEVFATRAIAWLADRGYSLSSEVPEGEGDTILRWLDSEEPGHCELFAGSLALLARQAGYPARLVVGFMGGDWNGYENYFMVRNRDAHAWVEIHNGEGWKRFDPTPGNSANARQLLNMASSRDGSNRTFGAYIDSLRMLWLRRIVNFDQEQQQEMVSGVREWATSLIQSVRQRLLGLWETVKSWFDVPWGHAEWLRLISRILLVLALWLALRLAWRFFRRWSARRGGHLGDFARSPVRRRAGKFVARFRAAAPVNPEGDWRALYGDLLTLRFGDPSAWPEPDQTFRSARRLLKARRKNDA